MTARHCSWLANLVLNFFGAYSPSSRRSPFITQRVEVRALRFVNLGLKENYYIVL